MVFFKILENELIDLPSLCGLLNILDDEKKIEQIEKYLKVWIKKECAKKEYQTIHFGYRQCVFSCHQKDQTVCGKTIQMAYGCVSAK